MSVIKNFVDRIIDEAAELADCKGPADRECLHARLMTAIEKSKPEASDETPAGKVVSNYSKMSKEVFRGGIELKSDTMGCRFAYDPSTGILRKWVATYLRTAGPKVKEQMWPFDASLLRLAYLGERRYELTADEHLKLRARLGRTKKQQIESASHYWLESKGMFGVSTILFDAAGEAPKDGSLYVLSDVWRPLLMTLEKDRAIEIRITDGDRAMVSVSDGMLSFAGFALRGAGDEDAAGTPQ